MQKKACKLVFLIKKNNFGKYKNLFQVLTKAVIYIVSFVCIAFILIHTISYFWLENQKLYQEEMISDILENVPN